jgi:GT2 family glycosyltransferase
MHQMPAEPLVWIIIVNWNGRDVTFDCLESLRAVTYGNRKILVVDNGSMDDSVPAIQKEYPEVEVLPLPENRRFAGGNNAGLTHGLAHGGELFLLLNNDTTVHPGFLEPLVDCLSSDPSAGIVVPKIFYYSDPARIWYAGGRISFWTGTIRHHGIRELDDGRYAARTATDYATGCCLLVRKDFVARAGLLDESYHMYTEDADWSVRGRRLGYSIVFEPRSMVWHKLSVSAGGHLSWYKMKNKFLSNFRFFSRYAAWYQWCVFPWLSLIANGLAALRYLFSRER